MEDRQRGSEPTISEEHHLLSNRRRRVVLAWLEERDDVESSLAELTELVLQSERDTGRERVALSLHHVHLPALSAAGILRYDTDSGCVTKSMAEHRDLQLPASRDG